MRREFHVRFYEGVGVRFPRATHLVIGFTVKEDAERVMAVLWKRMAAFGLTLHPDKTRIIPFARLNRTGKGSSASTPGTFDFLGFTLHWRWSRRGSRVPGMKTRKASIRKTLLRVGEWCRRHRHRPRAEQHAALSRKLQGHYEYFGVNGNFRCLNQVLHRVKRLWFKWLQRRGQRKPVMCENSITLFFQEIHQQNAGVGERSRQQAIGPSQLWLAGMVTAVAQCVKRPGQAP